LSGFWYKFVGFFVGKFWLPDKGQSNEIIILGAKCRECRVFTAVETPQEIRPVKIKPSGCGSQRQRWEFCHRRSFWTPVGLQTVVVMESRERKSLRTLVGPPGFEPGTSCTPSKRASQAAPRPDCRGPLYFSAVGPPHGRAHACFVAFGTFSNTKVCYAFSSESEARFYISEYLAFKFALLEASSAHGRHSFPLSLCDPDLVCGMAWPTAW
jgi:hypothetical protein